MNIEYVGKLKGFQFLENTDSVEGKTHVFHPYEKV